jgi:hypothetical protein
MNEPEQDDIELEISDLPGAQNRHRAPAFLLLILATRPRLRSRLWQAATFIIILCLFFILLPGYLPLLQQNMSGIFAHISQPTATDSSQHSTPLISQQVKSLYDTKNINIWLASRPLVVTSTALDNAPQNCPQYTLTQNVDAPSFSEGVGSSPMRVTGFSGPRATLNRLIRAQPPQFGWYQQLLLVGETNFNGRVTLHGGMVGSLLPLWFGVYPHGGPLITTVEFNPVDSSLSNHTTDDQQWGTLPINLYIARAGCYYLQATWENGGWTAYFAAGK